MRLESDQLLNFDTSHEGNAGEKKQGKKKKCDRDELIRHRCGDLAWEGHKAVSVSLSEAVSTCVHEHGSSNVSNERSELESSRPRGSTMGCYPVGGWGGSLSPDRTDDTTVTPAQKRHAEAGVFIDRCSDTHAPTYCIYTLYINAHTCLICTVKIRCNVISFIYSHLMGFTWSDIKTHFYNI